MEQRRCGHFGEGEVFGGARGALLPVEEEFAVAVGRAGSVIHAKPDEGVVDPRGRTFEFGEGADGGLVENEMGGYFGADGIGPLSAELLVDEDRDVAEATKDLSERGAIGDDGLGFDADLVTCGGVGCFVNGLALVRDRAERAILADAEDLAAGAEVAGGCVVERVVLEGARRVEVKAELGQAGFERRRVGHGELEFDLGCLHRSSIRRSGIRDQMRLVG